MTVLPICTHEGSSCKNYGYRGQEFKRRSQVPIDVIFSPRSGEAKWPTKNFPSTNYAIILGSLYRAFGKRKAAKPAAQCCLLSG